MHIYIYIYIYICLPMCSTNTFPYLCIWIYINKFHTCPMDYLHLCIIFVGTNYGVLTIAITRLSQGRAYGGKYTYMWAYIYLHRCTDYIKYEGIRINVVLMCNISNYIEGIPRQDTGVWQVSLGQKWLTFWSIMLAESL